MQIKINGYNAFVEITASGLIKLSIPNKGMFICERCPSTSEADIESTLLKTVKRASSLIWEFPEPRGVK